MTTIFDIPLEILVMCLEDYYSFMMFTSTCKQALDIRGKKSEFRELLRCRWIEVRQEDLMREEIKIIKASKKIQSRKYLRIKYFVAKEALKTRPIFVVKDSHIHNALRDYTYIDNVDVVIVFTTSFDGKDYASSYRNLKAYDITNIQIPDYLGQNRDANVETFAKFCVISDSGDTGLFTDITNIVRCVFGYDDILNQIEFDEFRSICDEKYQHAEPDEETPLRDIYLYRLTVMNLLLPPDMKDCDKQRIKDIVRKYQEDSEKLSLYK